jgi:hypothetical protein
MYVIKFAHLVRAEMITTVHVILTKSVVIVLATKIVSITYGVTNVNADKTDKYMSFFPNRFYCQQVSVENLTGLIQIQKSGGKGIQVTNQLQPVPRLRMNGLYLCSTIRLRAVHRNNFILTCILHLIKTPVTLTQT